MPDDSGHKLSTGIDIFSADVSCSLALPYADNGIQAGFPSPAQDYISESIDLNREIVKHPAATFYGRVEGDSMIEEGIEPGDILVIDVRSNRQTAICLYAASTANSP